MTFYLIIPIYNTQKYLCECLDSLLAQSYKHFKAILINDGSSDESGKIAESYAKKDTRFIYLSQENQGVSSARNTALDYIFNKMLIRGGQQGENLERLNDENNFIAFLDSDDMLESYALNHIAEILATNNCDAFISNRSFCIKDNKKQIFDYSVLKKTLENRSLTPQELIKIAPDSKLTTLWLFAFKATILQNARFEIDIFCGEDIVFCTFATLNSPKIYVDSTPIYIYRLREGSLVRSKDGTNKANSHFRIASIFYEKLQNESDKDYKRFYAYNLKQATKQTLSFHCEYKNLAFKREDLAKFMPFVSLKYRLRFYFPKIFGYLK